jgi:hypothetical protein
MSSSKKCCPICGKKYGFIDKISNASMCNECWKASKTLSGADSSDQKVTKQTTTDESIQKKRKTSILALMIFLRILWILWFLLLFLMVIFASASPYTNPGLTHLTGLIILVITFPVWFKRTGSKKTK